MNNKRILIGLFTLIVLVAVGTAGYQHYLAPEDTTPTPIASVQKITTINAEGRIVPSRFANLAFRIPGRVKAIHVEEGDCVRTDEVLIELDNTELLAMVDQARAAIDSALAQEALLPNNATKEAKDLAAANVKQARAALDAAEAGLEEAELKAPFEGIIVSVDVEKGEVTSPGFPVVVLAEESNWVVETLDLREEDVVQIKPGQTAIVKIAALPEIELQGRVDEIALSATSYQGNVTYTVTITLDHVYNDQIQWGMTVFIEIEPTQASELESAHPASVTPSPTPEVARTATPEPSSPTPSTTPTETEPTSLIHVVVEGENLFRISLRYGVSVEAIREANLITGNYIFVGQLLIIP